MSVFSKNSFRQVSQPEDMAQMGDIRRFEFLDRHLQSDANDALIDKLKEQMTKMKRATIQNVVTYAVCLLKPGQKIIDEVIFKAQMSNRFGLKDPVILEHIYGASCNLSSSNVIKSCNSWARAKVALQKSNSVRRTLKKSKATVLSLSNYCLLICIFISDVYVTKVDFVFNVFDQNRLDEIDIRDLSRLVRESVDFVMGNNVDEDKHDVQEENIRDVVEMLTCKFDIDKDGSISREEFHNVMRDPLMLDCLGHVFPDRTEVRTFRSLIVGKLPLEVRAFFRHERKRLLHQLYVENDRFQDLYPVKLEPWL